MKNPYPKSRLKILGVLNFEIKIEKMICHLTFIFLMDTRSMPHLKEPHGTADVYPSMVKNRAIGAFLNSLLETDGWNNAKSEREQVLFALDSCKENGFSVSQYELARFFGIERPTVQYHINHPFFSFENIPRPVGRIPLLSEDERIHLIQWIAKTHELRHPATYQVISEFIQDQFGKRLCLDTIRHMVYSMEELKVVTGKPMESDRIFCDSQKIDQYFCDLEACLEFGIPPEFIFNIDESGFQEWVDARNLQCVVPSSYPKTTVKIPRDRASKRSTMLGGICADGSTIKPMIILSRETIEKELLDHGYTPDKVQYGRSDSGFMNQELFLDWAKGSFIPEMRAKRAWHHYDGVILLLMDGFGVHDCDQFRELLSAENIHPLLFPPHSSDQTQFLDLLIFGLQKAEMQQMRISTNYNSQTQQVIKVLDSWRRVTTPRNVISAFRRGGLAVHWNAEENKLVATVDRSQARSVRHFSIGTSSISSVPYDKKRIRI